MQLLIIGFDEDDTRELSRHLRAAGHAVLGAQGRHGARTFIHAVTPDAVIIPEGPKGHVAAGWLDDLAATLPFVPAPVSADAADVIARALGQAAEPAPPPVPEVPERPEPDSESPTGGLFERFDRVAGVELAAPDAAPEAATVDAAGQDSAPFELAGVADASDAEDEALIAVVEVLAPARRGVPRTERGAAADSAQDQPPKLPGQSADDRGASEAREAEVAVVIHPDLASKLAHVRLGDYFSIVEVDPNASTWAIREAAERLGRRFSARGWPHRLHPEELEALDEISRGLADALLVLGDEGLRMRYQRALAAAAPGMNPGHAAR